MFLVAQMGQYLVHHGGVFDAGDDLDGTATAGAGFDVDVKDTLEAVRPCHGAMALNG